MQIIKIPLKSDKAILALGAESAGNFSFYQKGQVQLSPDFGDLFDHENFTKYKKAVASFLTKNNLKPAVILTDLHPLYHTTAYGQKLAKKYKAKLVQVQHHYAHVCSALGEYLSEGHKLAKQFIGIACDGTGYGLDGSIWGSEVFIFKIENLKFKIEHIGSLETQTLIGGDLAVKEPARMLLAILHKAKFSKEKIWQYVQKYYTKNQFELLYNQLIQNFNCQETTSTARILDAVSLLLGFCKNTRKYKHEPALLLENNSRTGARFCASTLYTLHPTCLNNKISTTHLFKYLIKNLHKNKKRLAATVQYYIAEGLFQVVRAQNLAPLPSIFFSGGIANNKIMSEYLKNKNAYLNKKIPRGDSSLSFGQIIYCLFS